MNDDRYVSADDARAAAEERYRARQECECRAPHRLRRYSGFWLCLLCGMLRYKG